MSTEKLTQAQAEIASFFCKFADFSYSVKEASRALDPNIAIESGWNIRGVRSLHDPASGMDFTIFVRPSENHKLDVAVCFRGAQVTWRPQGLDVIAGLQRGLPQWQKSRDLVLRKLQTPMRAALRSGGRIFITGQSMGHMLAQFAVADIIDSLNHDPTLAATGDWPLERIGAHIIAYGFGGVGVSDALAKVTLPSGRMLSAEIIASADVKHFLDDWDPARTFSWAYVGDTSRTWRASKPYPPFRTAVRKSLLITLWGITLPNLLAPVSFLWHFFYTAHSVTGYGLSDYSKSTPR
jgi:hypothetical protein